MEFKDPEHQAAHGPFAAVRTTSLDETDFLLRVALATHDKDFYDQVAYSIDPEDGTTLAMRAFVEHAMEKTLSINPIQIYRNAAFRVSRQRARAIQKQIAQ